ncbi:mitochondrial carrier domain-containing protein [Gamsiella multidivaricata]|uniref:mitochondrial carrier domain-containing protein n=1 Tax=Gamsiella multidivaricata TaxID=101098 RepID=UPI00221E4534|nr:mitochondrial carrier domain-containing protein [Gamsiella multidivaricata]KAI7818587.1 mitochondrial carrier domain-containing protein [Gamsiella multidivaricata]
MSEAELQRFIKAMDKDGDGMIDYEEWRDFLVLLPRETTLKDIYHYVQEVVAQVGVDGDVVMPPSENDYVARYLLAGAIAGAVSRTATAPLDRLKVYLITNSVPALTGPAAQAGLKYIPKFSSPNASAVAPVKQRLLWNALIELYHQGGIKTFFRGNGLNIIKIAPESAIKFYTYETSKAFIVNHLPSLTVQPHHHQIHSDGSVTTTTAGSGSNNGGAKPHHPPDIATSGRFLAGGIAGVVSQFSIYPLETIKTRIMSSTGRSKRGQRASSAGPGITAASSATLPSGSAPSLPTAASTKTLAEATTARKPCIRSVAREMWQKAGLRGFYRGLGPSLVGIFPYAAIDLSVFETLKFGYMRWKAGVHEGDEGSEEKSLERPSVFVLLACGTVSGSVGATSVYPLSLVRTRLQAQGTPHHPQTYTSTLDVFRKTYEQEGLRGFYKGMVPTLTKVVPAVSISYVVYEYSKRELGL